MSVLSNLFAKQRGKSNKLVVTMADYSLNSLIVMWESVALTLGLSSFQLVVVLGMLSTGMFAQWQFQHRHHHHHDE